MPALVSLEEAAALIHDEMTVMFGGFMGCGTPHDLIDVLAESGVKDLTLICNDASMPGGPMKESHYGVAKLVHNHQVRRFIATHVGLNPEVAKQSMEEGTLEVILVPQGSLAEMIRAGGAGLGGILTPTGVGTIVEDSPLCLGKQTIHGKDYLLMDALRADVAVIAGSVVDPKGNVWYRGATSNFNPLMATAADTVIVEAEEMVYLGYIRPEDVRTQSIYVDYVVRGGKNVERSEFKTIIAKRVAKELNDGDVVNLGIGLPTMVPRFLPDDVHVTLQSENGILGTAAVDEWTHSPLHVVDAGGSPSAVAAGGAFIDSATSFAMIRGGHVDATILGGLEVDEEGSLSNWIIPGKKMPGMGGAMDLLAGARKVIIAMEHTAKGAPKILKKCRLPYTAVRCVDKIITEMAVIEVTKDGLLLSEYNPAFTLEEIQAATEAELIISEDLKPMC